MFSQDFKCVVTKQGISQRWYLCSANSSFGNKRFENIKSATKNNIIANIKILDNSLEKIVYNFTVGMTSYTVKLDNNLNIQWACRNDNGI